MPQDNAAGEDRRKEVGPGTIAHAVREQRKALGLTQTQLANRVRLGKRQSHISEIERGAIHQPRRETILALAAALELQEAELLARSGYPDIDVYLAALPPLPPNLGPDGERIVDLLDVLGADDIAAVRRYVEFLAYDAQDATPNAALLVGDDADLAERIAALPPKQQDGLREAVERMVRAWEEKAERLGVESEPCPNLS